MQPAGAAPKRQSVDLASLVEKMEVGVAVPYAAGQLYTWAAALHSPCQLSAGCASCRCTAIAALAQLQTAASLPWRSMQVIRPDDVQLVRFLGSGG